MFRREIESIATATGIGVYTPSMLRRTILRGACRRTVENTLASVVSDGILVRLCRGAYHYPHARPERNVMEEAALRLRPRKFSYISLETALAGWGVINQQTFGCTTVMTTGRSQRLSTPYGMLEFTHTSKSPIQVAALLTRPQWPTRALPWAKPRLAARELVRVGRNTDLILWDDLEDIEAEMAQ